MMLVPELGTGDSAMNKVGLITVLLGLRSNRALKTWNTHDPEGGTYYQMQQSIASSCG